MAILLAGITAGLTTVLEEVGWTGFAVPRLRRRHGVVATGLIVGVLWGTWHLLIAFWASRGLAGEAPLAGFIAGFGAFYFVALPAYRVLMVWVYDHTASLLLAMLMHAVLSLFTFIATFVHAWYVVAFYVCGGADSLLALAWFAMTGRRFLTLEA